MLAELPPIGYVCSVSQRGRFRRLHFIGSCWRQPGIHYLQWESLDDEKPDFSKVDARCSECFPDDKAPALPSDNEDGSSSSSSSSS